MLSFNNLTIFYIFQPVWRALIGFDSILSEGISALTVILLTSLSIRFALKYRAFFIFCTLLIIQSILIQSTAKEIFLTFRIYLLPLSILYYYLDQYRSEKEFGNRLIKDFKKPLLVTVILYFAETLILFITPSYGNIFMWNPLNTVPSRTIGIFQDYQSSAFILSLLALTLIICGRYLSSLGIGLLVFFGGMRSWLVSLIFSSIIYWLYALYKQLRVLRIKKYFLFIIIFFFIAMLTYIIPLYLYQFEGATNTSGRIIIDYLTSDFNILLSEVKLMGSGYLDYSSIQSSTNLSIEVLRNEVGFLRILIELGPVLLASYLLCYLDIYRKVSQGGSKTLQVQLFIPFVFCIIGTGHHLTFLNLTSQLSLFIGILCIKKYTNQQI